MTVVAERPHDGSRGIHPTEYSSGKAARRGATPEPNRNRALQASLRDARFLRPLPVTEAQNLFRVAVAQAKERGVYAACAVDSPGFLTNAWAAERYGR